MLEKLEECNEKCHINNNELHEKQKKNLISRLNKIEGQIRGIKRLIESDTYCDDVLNQISSSKAALNGVSKLILERHIETCVSEKLKSNDPTIINEFIKTIERILK
ncbi:metal-sensitive transcriptional regulator [Ilyobacter sp.]|jgi:DNA-binding FrmR family transcriptional regulator|uniref:metal-sensitive transcriptional regulator n=1 Tax=Ilyobacter sp. TaxID=3100343 RepID=UPI00356AEBAC